MHLGGTFEQKEQQALLFQGYVGTREDKGPQETVVPKYPNIVKPYVISLDYQFTN